MPQARLPSSPAQTLGHIWNLSELDFRQLFRGGGVCQGSIQLGTRLRWDVTEVALSLGWPEMTLAVFWQVDWGRALLAAMTGRAVCRGAGRGSSLRLELICLRAPCRGLL